MTTNVRLCRISMVEMYDHKLVPDLLIPVEPRLQPSWLEDQSSEKGKTRRTHHFGFLALLCILLIWYKQKQTGTLIGTGLNVADGAKNCVVVGPYFNWSNVCVRRTFSHLRNAQAYVDHPFGNIRLVFVL